MQDNNGQEPTTPTPPEPTAPVNNPTEVNTTPAEVPIQPQPVAPLQPEKHNKKLLLIIIAAAVVIGLGIAGFFMYQTMQNPDTTTSDNSDASQNKTATVNDAEGIVERVREAIVGDISDNNEGNSPLYQAPNASYYVSAAEGTKVYGISSSTITKELNEAQGEDATVVLKDNGFVMDTFYEKESDFPGVSLWYSDKAVCQLVANGDYATYDATTDSYETYEFSLRCSDAKEYESAVKEYKPFYAAFLANKEQYHEGVVFTRLKTTPSESTGYELATISQYTAGHGVGGYVGFYYQTPDKEWHYFEGRQDVPECSDFNTPDLQKAYLGTDCYDVNGEAKVTIKE